MAFLRDLPLELLLQIFSQLVLKSLLQARGVCKFWQYILLNPFTLVEIHPARRQLWRLWDELVHTPLFLRTRPPTRVSLDSPPQPFDRQAYVDHLKEPLARNKIPALLPEGIEIFILEWPSKAAFNGIWPGLRDTRTPQEELAWNFLVYNMPPDLYELELAHQNIVPALPVLVPGSDKEEGVWIVMDSRHHLFGRAVILNGLQPSYRPIQPLNPNILADNGQAALVVQHEMLRESKQLPFLDWLDVSLDRWKLDVNGAGRDKAIALALYDKKRQRWYHFAQEGAYCFTPTARTLQGEAGGNLPQFEPMTPVLSPGP